MSLKLLQKIGIVLAFLPAVSLHAQLLFNSDVYANGRTNTGMSDFKEALNQRFSGRQVTLADTVGNEAKGMALLSMESGSLLGSTHACSGGSLFYGGNASGSGHALFTQAYRLISPSLPIGTLVPIRFSLSSVARAVAGGDSLVGADDSDSAEVFVQFSMYDASNTLLSASGDWTQTRTLAGPDEHRSGNFKPDDGEETLDFNEAIGSVITVSIEGFVAANSSALPVAFAEGDGQLSLVWGLTPGTADTMLVSDDGGTLLAPPAENATPDRATELLPARPVFDTPEPSGLAAFGLFYCLAVTRRRPKP